MGVRYPQIHQLNGIINHLGLDINEQLKVFKPYMLKNDIDGLVKKGFTVGAHSAEHPEYYLLDEQTQLDQSIKSINQIKEWFNPKYAAFAFPFTDYGVKNSFFEKLESDCSVDVTFGCAGIKKHYRQNHIQRIPMDDFPFSAESRLRSEYLHSFLKKLIGKNSVKNRL
jgi:peptidoglycan/xylan/chitin deacetylase (PgdA/CDA1 family)